MSPRPPLSKSGRNRPASAPRGGRANTTNLTSRLGVVRQELAKARSDLTGFIEALTHSDVKLRADVLLEDSGEPTALYQAIIDAGQHAVDAVFRTENWEGASKAELRSVLNALPDELREAIPNRQTLLANASRNDRAARAR